MDDKYPTEIEAAAHFLVERLAEFEGEVGGEPETACSVWFGEVSPALARLKSALAGPLTVRRTPTPAPALLTRPPKEGWPPIEGEETLLWCAFVRGPDDLYAARSYEDAVKICDEINLYARRQHRAGDPVVIAYPAIWPYTPEGHAEDLKRVEEERQAPSDTVKITASGLIHSKHATLKIIDPGAPESVVELIELTKAAEAEVKRIAGIEDWPTAQALTAEEVARITGVDLLEGIDEGLGRIAAMEAGIVGIDLAEPGADRTAYMFRTSKTEFVPARFVHADCGVRDWEDATVNGVEDTEGKLIPGRVGDRWEVLIDIETGRILNWPQGTTADIHYKVCDDGSYTLIGSAYAKGGDGETMPQLAKIDGYVPEFMAPAEDDHGFGDYVIMTVDGQGLIAGWQFDIEAFSPKKGE